MAITKSYAEIKASVYLSVCDRLLKYSATDDEQVLKTVRECIIADKDSSNLTPRQRGQMSHELFNRIRRLDVLQDLLDDDSVTEIMVNGVDEIFAEREGRIAGCGIRFESKERLLDIISKIASGVNRTINLSSPILDARLPDGSRVNAVLDPVAINGPILTIRRFPKRPIDSDMLIRSNSITDEALDCLKSLVRAKYNILVSGSTGSGKTTLLNVLSGFIPSDERIITIEDSAELRIRGIRNLVRLETRSATANGSGEISIRDLIRSALRMRPDRIIVGEVRGEEAIDMLQAFNVGQDGSLSTIHANSAQDALSRLETMIMLSTQIPIEALRRQIISGVDIIVHLGRFRDGSRHVLEIKEMVKTGSDKIETRPLFEYRKGKLVGINELTYTGKLERQA